jgi:hypothetical protein
MSIHGWIAMTIGIVISLGLGAGLMALTFFSSRHGYDDRLPPPDEPSPDAEARGPADAP